MYMRVAIIHYCREGSEYLHFYDDHVAAVQACLAHYNWANGADRGVLAECLTSVCDDATPPNVLLVPALGGERI